MTSTGTGQRTWPVRMKEKTNISIYKTNTIQKCRTYFVIYATFRLFFSPSLGGALSFACHYENYVYR